MKKKRDLFNRGKMVLLVMKITILILIISTMHVSASVNAQSSKFNLDVKQVSIEQMLEQMKAKCDYTFLYRSDLFDNLPPVNINVKESTVEEILDKYVVPQGFSYTVMDNQVIFFERAEEELAEANEAELEAVEVKGTIKDKDGVPLPGATILEEGTFNGVTSNANGEFTIEVSNQNAKLKISYIGFETQIIPVKGVSVLNVIMKESASSLEEVVVTGYTKTSKTRSSSSATKVAAIDVERQVTVDLSDRMEGLSTGLNINTITRDGGQEKIELILRGISTFDEEGDNFDAAMQDRNSLNRQPLIVVDGFPYEGPFNDIDQATIESIDVLKDASATALWGLRASNGVIVVTTKRGKAGKPTVAVSSNWTFGTKQDLSGFGLASSADIIALKNAAMDYMPTYQNTAYNVVNYVALSWVYDPVLGWTQVVKENLGYKYATVDAYDNIWAQFYEGSITDTERDQLLTNLGQRNVLKQFEDHLLRGGFNSQNTVSIRGGSNYSNYNLTVSHTQEKDPNMGDDFERFNVSLTNDFNLTDKWKAQVDVSLVTSNNNDNGIGVATLYTGSRLPIINMYDQLVDDQGNPLDIRWQYGDRETEFLERGFDPIGFSPITDYKLRDNNTSSFNIRIAGGMNYKITD